MHMTSHTMLHVCSIKLVRAALHFRLEVRVREMREGMEGGGKEGGMEGGRR